MIVVTLKQQKNSRYQQLSHAATAVPTVATTVSATATALTAIVAKEKRSKKYLLLTPFSFKKITKYSKKTNNNIGSNKNEQQAATIANAVDNNISSCSYKNTTKKQAESNYFALTNTNINSNNNNNNNNCYNNNNNKNSNKQQNSDNFSNISNCNSNKENHLKNIGNYLNKNQQKQQQKAKTLILTNADKTAKTTTTSCVSSNSSNCSFCSTNSSAAAAVAAASSSSSNSSSISFKTTASSKSKTASNTTATTAAVVVNNYNNNNNQTINNYNNHSSKCSTTTTSAVAPTNHSSNSMSPTSQTPSRTSLFDSCHRKIRLIGGGPVAFLGGLVAKARRKERDGDQNSTDTKLYLEESVLERKLPEADLKALVDLPAGLDYNEWLASHTLALFEHVNLVYGTISEFCTPSGCSDMTGPANRTYLWFDEKGKKTRVAAPQYIDYVMTFTQKTVSDESIFPTKYANEFPSSFESIARKILRLQFHVIAHLYAAHFREIALLGLHTHLNLTFAHLTALHRRFNLIDEKETDVLRDLEVALRLTDDSQQLQQQQQQQDNAEQQHNHSNITQQQQQHQQQQICNATTNSSNQTAAVAVNAGLAGSIEDVNLLQTACAAVVAASGGGGALIDGDAAAPPICTQPEAAAKTNAVPAIFGAGGGNLIGGILGDLTSGEFGDTTRYCTSAVPASSCSPSSCNSNIINSTNAIITATATATTDVDCNTNGGAGALHLNLNHNNNNNNINLQQYAHAHGHHHALHHHAQLQHNSGLIQCNVSNAPNASTSNTSTTTTA